MLLNLAVFSICAELIVLFRGLFLNYIDPDADVCYSTGQESR